jgi:hypothetical protein
MLFIPSHSCLLLTQDLTVTANVQHIRWPGKPLQAKALQALQAYLGTAHHTIKHFLVVFSIHTSCKHKACQVLQLCELRQ